VALVLWGSDNIKSDGGPIAQALALMGARPRFDSYGRLSGADLIPLAELGRPRIDVVMTLSGIFRDLLPLQTRMLAEAAWKAARPMNPAAQNFIRAHALAYARAMGVRSGNRRAAGVFQCRRRLWIQRQRAGGQLRLWRRGRTGRRL
jgi:magnesium chelatase subunit H